MSNTNDLIRFIQEGTWSDVMAMPVQSSQSNLLDVVFKTDKGNVRITGKDIQIGDGEWFKLSFFKFKEKGWWDLSNEENKWKHIDFSSLWVNSDIKELYKPPRILHFYTNDALNNAQNIDLNYSEKSVAVEITKNVSGTNLRLLIVASQDHPYTVNLSWGEDDVESALENMTKLHIT